MLGKPVEIKSIADRAAEQQVFPDSGIVIIKFLIEDFDQGRQIRIRKPIPERRARFQDSVRIDTGTRVNFTRLWTRADDEVYAVGGEYVADANRFVARSFCFDRSLWREVPAPRRWSVCGASPATGSTPSPWRPRQHLPAGR